MPVPRIRLFRKANAAVSQIDYLYAIVVAYTPNLRRDEQLVRVKVEGP